MMPKLSVIIPFYNVERYLDRCLNSVRQQSLKEIEIICVDDCSPDNSYAIAKKHASNDSRIRIIRHNKNLGLGGARNTAIKVARADYIASVDSDDYIMPNMLERLWVESENGKYDVVCCGFNKVNKKEEILSSHSFESRSIYNKNNSIDIFSTINPAFWNKLWKRSLFMDNKIFFPEHLYFEDMPTTPCILARSHNVKIIDDILYNYSIRLSSITSSFTEKHIFDYFKGFELLMGFLAKNSLINRYKKEFEVYVDTNMRFYSQRVLECSDMNTPQKEQYLRQLLMMKIGFLELFSLLRLKKIDSLYGLLGSAKTKEDLRKL